ncbi:MAG TPA: lipoprotein [Burkholderiales bacterium]|nr:lipoprotein [Burkholderiales bacterium]
MPGKLGVLHLEAMDMSALRTIVGAAAVLLLELSAVSSIVACGKKGPLYLPDPAPSASAPANYSDQERR